MAPDKSRRVVLGAVKQSNVEMDQEKEVVGVEASGKRMT
jgi:hypothetical protein